MHFIKPPYKHVTEYSTYSPAIMMRRRFFVEQEIISAKLSVCGLGCGYYYINGKTVSDDLFTAPVSNYNRTLWVNEYDVTDMLSSGENLIAIWLGNGNFNENINTPWDINKAPYRDNPKVMIRLEIITPQKTMLLEGDEKFKCTQHGGVTFNQLRNGEYFDFNLHDEQWIELSYDDENWDNAVFDEKPPKGEFRMCHCEPIRELREYKPQTIRKTNKGSYVFDFGQNMSGYIRLSYKGKKGQKLTIKYAEVLDEDGCATTAWDYDYFYRGSEYATDKLVLSGEKFVWSPKFVYHGFRYIEIVGLLEEPYENQVRAVFVSQDLAEKTTFECSNELISQLYLLGKNSTRNNMHYIPTDCPTREKLGWANDAQASCEQFLTNFHSEKFLEKWFYDVLDAVKENGAISCVIPTHELGYGYGWGTGPVSDGILFELPYRLYLHTGNQIYFEMAFPYFSKYLKYIITKTNERGLIDFGLCDWAGPFDYQDLEGAPTPRAFTDTLLYIKFLKLAIFAATVLGKNFKEFEMELTRISAIFREEYINEDGSCKIQEQTAIAMLIYIGFYDNIEPLKEQLKNTVEQRDYHLYVGMVGMRYLLHALSKCNMDEYAYKIVNATGYPSFRDWVERGATTLWETFQCEHSRDHHMYSDIISWFVKEILGIKPMIEGAGYKEMEVSPFFFQDISCACGSYKIETGQIRVDWKKKNGLVDFCICIPCGIQVRVYFKNAKNHDGRREMVLKEGQHSFKLQIIECDDTKIVERCTYL